MDQGTKMHLREWLIAQVDSGLYEGLSWEDEERTMFRIPWKHAAKKDYKQTADAAIFKAWTVYKGKFREGKDREDPTMWKTRLRCALNKSTDFKEVPERSQLDITEPYKVYRIQTDNAAGEEEQQRRSQVAMSTTPPPSDRQVHCQKEVIPANKQDVHMTDDHMMEHTYCDFEIRKPPPQDHAPLQFHASTFTVSDFRLQVELSYLGQTVTKVTTVSPDGCFILQGCVPLGNERIYGPCTAQQLSFPSPANIFLQSSFVEAMNRLLCHLERGVLLWVAPDGVFIKRFCQGRVYWSGPMAKHTDQPNKLDRERTFKLLDIPRFLNELQNHQQSKGPIPPHAIELCFGEEYPDPKVPKAKKLIMARVVPLFAEELLQRCHSEGASGKQPSDSTHGEKTQAERSRNEAIPGTCDQC